MWCHQPPTLVCIPRVPRTVGSAHSFAGTLLESGTCAAGHVAQPSPPVGSRTLVCSSRALSVNAADAGRALRVSPGTSAPVGAPPRPPPAHLCVGLCGWTWPGSLSLRASGAHLAPAPAPLPSAAARPAKDGSDLEPAKPSFLSALPAGREEYALAGAGAGTLVHRQEALRFSQDHEGTGDRCGCPRPPVPPACPVRGCVSPGSSQGRGRCPAAGLGVAAAGCTSSHTVLGAAALRAQPLRCPLPPPLLLSPGAPSAFPALLPLGKPCHPTWFWEQLP